MSIRWLENLFASKRSRPRLRALRRPRNTQPQLEPLEPRRLPSITTLASLMDAPNGGTPGGGLVADTSGNLFGATSRGGAYGDGTIFEIAHGSTAITTLATFNGANGQDPQSTLIVDSDGNLYGTALLGGAYGYGTAFEFDGAKSAILTLGSFNGFDGAFPSAALFEDGQGNLFGTTNVGGPTWNPARTGYSYGTVFEIAKGSHVISPLASCTGFDIAPSALVEDKSGNLWGTTAAGAGGQGACLSSSPVAVL